VTVSCLLTTFANYGENSTDNVIRHVGLDDESMLRNSPLHEGLQKLRVDAAWIC